jgi:uncharacterized membrane protein
LAGGFLSTPVLAGAAAGVVIGITVIVIVIVRIARRPPAESSSANEFGGVDLPATAPVELGADVTGVTEYYVTEANAFADDVPIGEDSAGDDSADD